MRTGSLLHTAAPRLPLAPHVLPGDRACLLGHSWSCPRAKFVPILKFTCRLCILQAKPNLLESVRQPDHATEQSGRCSGAGQQVDSAPGRRPFEAGAGHQVAETGPTSLSLGAVSVLCSLSGGGHSGLSIRFWPFGGASSHTPAWDGGWFPCLRGRGANTPSPLLPFLRRSTGRGPHAPHLSSSKAVVC